MAEYIGYEKELEFPAFHGVHPKYTVLTGEEIIRCRDCFYSHKGSGRGMLCSYFEDANGIPALVTPNGFCAWAERDA